MSLAPGTPPCLPVTERDRAQFATSHLGSALVLVTVDGEIDAANALDFSSYVEAELESNGRLAIDMRTLKFFGIQGFSMLHRINVMCSRRAVNWVLIAGTEVDRVLSICDPDGALPVSATLEEAIAAVIRPPRNHLRLVGRD